MSKTLLTSLVKELNLDLEAQNRINDLIEEAALHQSADWAAHMTPAVDKASIVGKAIAAYHNGNLLSPKLYPHLKTLEQEVLRWLSGKFNLDYGYATAGASYGNLEALWHARDSHKHSNYVYGSDACHYSIPKACEILGLRFISVDTGDSGHIDVEALQSLCEKQVPAAVVLNLGNTSNGEIDPLDECIAISKQAGAWCHIDAAWGGFLAFIDEFQLLTSAISRADSLCFDPHKALCQSKPSGLIFYQTPRSRLSIDANYLSEPPPKSISGSLGGELFLSLWLCLKAYGEDYFIEEIQQRLRQAKLFADGLDKNLFWSHCSDTGIVCFAPRQKMDLTSLVEAGIFSTTHVNEKECYRAVFASSSTTAEALLLKLKNHL